MFGFPIRKSVARPIAGKTANRIVDVLALLAFSKTRPLQAITGILIMTLRSKTALLVPSLALMTALPAMAQMPDHTGHKMPSHDMAGMKHDRSAHMVEALATVTAILPDDNRIGLSHGAIPEVSWPAATMKFPMSDSIDVTAFKPGDRVQFTLHRAKNGSLPLVELCPTTATEIQPGLCAGRGMMDNGNTDHGSMEHSQMDHGAMDHTAMGHVDMEKASVTTTGTVLRIDPAAWGLRIKHDPIPEIGWPVMTMQFEVADDVDLTGLSDGDAISFDFDPEMEDGYVISAIRPVTDTPKTKEPAADDHDNHDGH